MFINISQAGEFVANFLGFTDLAFFAKKNFYFVKV